MIRIIVAGSKTFTDYDKLREVMDAYLADLDPEQIEIISGGCRGANALAEQYGEENDMLVTRFPLGPNDRSSLADSMRNEKMVEYAAQDDGAVVAFWDGRSRGTENLIQHARTYMLDVNIIRI